VFAPSFDGAFASRRICMVILFRAETESSLEVRIRFAFLKHAASFCQPKTKIIQIYVIANYFDGASTRKVQLKLLPPKVIGVI
jgi:hypothetical protein